MQRGPAATPLELIWISEAARLIGLNKSTLSRQVKRAQRQFRPQPDPELRQ